MHAPLLAILLFGLLLHGAAADDLTTIKGTTYRDYAVIKSEPGFLTISYDEGTAKIKAEMLPADIRQKYGLDSPAQQTLTSSSRHLNELVLKDGTAYVDVEVIDVLPDGLNILHKDGGAKIPFEKLPDYICKLYGITAEKALEYRSSVEREREVAAAAAAASSDDTNAPPVPQYDSSSAPQSESSPSPASDDGTVYVHGYYRKNGTYVHSYTRRK